MQNFINCDSVDCHQITYINMHAYTFKWSLHDIKKYDDAEIKSDAFYPDNKGPWWLSLSFGRAINMQLCRNGLGYGPVICSCKVQISDSNNCIMFQDCLRMQYLNNNNCGSSTIISDSDIRMNFDFFNAMRNGKIKDSINITLFLEIQEKVSESINYCPDVDGTFCKDIQEAVAKDLAIMFDNQVNTDVVFKVSDESIGAHKSILSARSSVFAKMFEQDMSENQTSVVNVQDVSPFALKELIAFIYGKHRTDYDFNQCFDVYYVADKYDMLQLKDLCGGLLLKILTVENVGEILQLFDMHNDTKLKTRTLPFIRNNLESCVKMSWWEELMMEKSLLSKELELFLTNINK